MGPADRLRVLGIDGSTPRIGRATESYRREAAAATTQEFCPVTIVTRRQTPDVASLVVSVDVSERGVRERTFELIRGESHAVTRLKRGELIRAGRPIGGNVQRVQLLEHHLESGR